MKSLRLGFVVVLLTFLFAAGAVCAAENEAKPKGIVGLGVGIAPDYEGSDEYEAVPLWRFQYQWDSGRNIVLFANELTVNLLAHDTVQAGPLLRYRPERNDVENDRVDRMKKVDAATELGAFISVKVDKWKFTFTGAQDVSDAHDGYVLELKGAYVHSINPDLAMILQADTSYASKDYMRTYFGVNNSDAAASGIRPYKSDNDLKDVGLSATVTQNLSPKWQMMYIAKYTALIGDAKDSPLVDDEGDSNQLFAGVLASYRF